MDVTCRSWSRTTSPALSASAEPATHMVGSVLAGKYLLEEIVGEGAMGVVVRARHLQLDEYVAVKIPRAGASTNRACVDRILREARALARVRCENVASVMDVGVLRDGEPFLVMELLDGHDLAAELAERGPLPPSEILDIVGQACRAAHHAHQMGIVHRDLKPSNVYLAHGSNRRRIVKIIDFGIAGGEALAGMGEARSTKTGILGSPAYMSPEQIRTPESADARSDIWSLGALLYEMYSGEPPFGATNTAAVLSSICSAATPPLRIAGREAPAPIAAVVARCLAKSPSERFSTALELSDALVRALAASEWTSLRTTSRSCSAAPGRHRSRSRTPRRTSWWAMSVSSR